MTKQEFISKLISTIPNCTGVYCFYNTQKSLLYVGKAKNLKFRVNSYFNNTSLCKKTQVLVKQIDDIKYTVVFSEMDALLLENNLIKKHQPKYNVLLKDDKTYPWICIKNEPLPRIFQTRKIIKDGSEYYGPFMSTNIIKVLLDFFSDLFYDKGWTPFSYLNRRFDKNSKKEYLVVISEIRKILKGDIKSIVTRLQKNMLTHSERLEFEQAQKIKNVISLIKNYQSKSTIISPKITDVDVFTLLNSDSYAYVNYLKILSGSVVQTHTVEIKKKLNESPEDLLKIVIIDLRERFGSSSKKIFCSHKIKDVWGRINIIVPKIGDKKKLINLSLKNARQMELASKKIRVLRKEKSTNTQAVRQLQKDLRLKEPPIYIECFDNSNTQGSNPVSACVVFKHAKASKKDYRIFNIKSHSGIDDFRSIEEVIYRRYFRLKNEGLELPQLIIVDGGKGQLNSAIKSLKKLNLYGAIPLIGVAKKLEKIYFPKDPDPLYLDKRSSSLRLIQKLRNEAHRFSLFHHRKQRNSTFLTSSLDSIKGIGPKTIEKLILRFGSVKNILAAEKKEIEHLIGKKKSEQIFK